VLDPVEMTIEAKFTLRGGIASTAIATYKKKEKS